MNNVCFRREDLFFLLLREFIKPVFVAGVCYPGAVLIEVDAFTICHDLVKFFVFWIEVFNFFWQFVFDWLESRSVVKRIAPSAYDNNCVDLTVLTILVFVVLFKLVSFVFELSQLFFYLRSRIITPFKDSFVLKCFQDALSSINPILQFEISRVAPFLISNKFLIDSLFFRLILLVKFLFLLLS